MSTAQALARACGCAPLHLVSPVRVGCVEAWMSAAGLAAWYVVRVLSRGLMTPPRTWRRCCRAVVGAGVRVCPQLLCAPLSCT